MTSHLDGAWVGFSSGARFDPVIGAPAPPGDGYAGLDLVSGVPAQPGDGYAGPAR
ncbi:hypothetical protein [Streptomyces palmae]|uniref:hypothetical protein n=1 Tax=Streptomyces palmae TaxID=1701085 RepID=UPI0014333E30|nr:hypothetical protein [Streptomyces palmae]